MIMEACGSLVDFKAKHWLWNLKFLTPFLQSVLAFFPNLAGVILFPEVLLTGNPPPDSIVESGKYDGSIAVTCPIPGGNPIKESIIVTQTGKFTEQAQIFADLYANENTWLNWALEKLGKPPFDELVHLSEQAKKNT